MGFFSWKCKGCRQGIRNVHSGEAPWMYEVVAMRPNGTTLFGSYDGYGRVDGTPIDEDFIAGDVEVWHRMCWDNAEKPKYTGPSEDDPEQGHWGEPPSLERVVKECR